MLDVTLDNSTKARIRVVPTTASGKPARIEAGSLTVTPGTAPDGVSNPVVAIESDDTFTVQADLADGTATADLDFTVTGDADLGAGVTTLTDVVRAHLQTEQATNLGLTQVEIVPR